MKAEIPGQVLTFVLGTEHYGVDILRVQEIRGWAAITKIPHAPAHVLGVLNLRGTIVPVVDLRMRFALEHAAYTPTTVIIVLSLVVSGSTRHVGVVVDAVSDVMDVNVADVRPAPELSGCTATDYMIGILTTGTQMTMLLEIDQLIGNEIASLTRSAA